MTTVDPAAATSATASPSPAAPALGKDAFLKLLVAQLRYQDPMNPADSSAFLAQTAQFTMVEKLEEMARQGVDTLAAQRTTAAGSLLGRRVTYVGSDGADETGVVTAVRLGASSPVLRIGEHDVPLAAVKEVSSAS